MARKTVDDLVAELEKITLVFKKKAFTVGDIDEKKLGETATGLRGKSKELEEVKVLTTNLVNQLNGLIAAGQDMQTRGLSGIRAAFGSDSTEYEEAGGVRKSERKKPTPKKKA
jgi:hypothetical protein